MEPFSREIQEHQFSSAMRGYSRAEVDAFITDCGVHMGSLEEQLRIAEVRAARSDEELARLRAEIDDLLRDATEARRKIIEEAKAQALTIADQSASMDGSDELTDAAAKATAIISEAESTASLRLVSVEQLRSAAQDDAAAIVRKAEETAALTQAEADRLLEKARMDANSIREETESTRASLEAQLVEIRSILTAARTETIDLDDLTTVEISGGSDPDLVVDLRNEKTTTETRHAADEPSAQA